MVVQYKFLKISNAFFFYSLYIVSLILLSLVLSAFGSWREKEPIFVQAMQARTPPPPSLSSICLLITLLSSFLALFGTTLLLPFIFIHSFFPQVPTPPSIFYFVQWQFFHFRNLTVILDTIWVKCVYLSVQAAPVLHWHQSRNRPEHFYLFPQRRSRNKAS